MNQHKVRPRQHVSGYSEYLVFVIFLIDDIYEKKKKDRTIRQYTGRARKKLPLLRIHITKSTSQI